MRYKVEIAAGRNASQVADAVSTLHGSWDHATDGFPGLPGIAFITANEGEDEDLCLALEDHDGVVGYTTAEWK